MKLTLRKKPKKHWTEKLANQIEHEPTKYVLSLLVFAGVALLAEQYWEKIVKTD